MSLFNNNYRRLKNENNKEIEKLSGKNWDPLKRMMEYTASFDVSLFELEVIKKDLIGIAREADSQNEDLTDKLGIPEKEFCDSLIKGIMKRSGWEQIILSVRYVMNLIFLFYAMDFFITGAPFNYGIFLLDVIFAVLCWGSNFVLNRFSISRTVYVPEKKRKAIVLATFVLWIFVFSPLMIWKGGDFFIVYGNGWVILAVLAVLTALINYGNNYYWDKCSEKYNWQ